jgi:hypothetical protein
MIRNEVLQEAYKSRGLNVKFLRDGRAEGRGEKSISPALLSPSKSYESFVVECFWIWKVKSPALPLFTVSTD